MENFLDIENIIQTGKNITTSLSEGIDNLQNNFLQSEFGKVVDNAVDMGLKALLPDFLEDQIINIKDTLIQDGVKAGINEAIESSIDLGKSAIGIFTGNFENIDQIQNAVKKGGLVDTISSVIGKTIDVVVDAGFLDKGVGKIIKNGKNTLFKTISNNIDNSLTNQVNYIEKIDKYCETWKNAYEKEDLKEMNKAYKNINKQLENIVPLESTINKAREIENLQKIITNNGGNFNLTDEQLQLVGVL